MGDRVPAMIEIGPYDEESLQETEAGRRLLDLIGEMRFDDREVYLQSGVPVLSLTCYEANYGTDAFEEAGLPPAASEAGLWCAMSDAGSLEWDRHHSVSDPGGNVHSFTGSQTSAVVVDQGPFLALCAKLSDTDVVAYLRRYFEEGNHTLGEWIAEDAATR
ncbi:MAG: hypothetical protein ACYCST_16975 [Acidimicrobiales bacterium]